MADFPERNLKITLRFALRFLKVRPRHRGLSPGLPRATWVCPQGYPWVPKAIFSLRACPHKSGQGACPQWCKPRFRGPQGYGGACPPLISGACPPLILSVVPF